MATNGRNGHSPDNHIRIDNPTILAELQPDTSGPPGNERFPRETMRYRGKE